MLKAMRFMRPLFIASAVVLTMAASHAADKLPAQNLWVEIRWVDSSISPDLVAAARDGSTVVGTSGSISPKGWAGYSTGSHEDAQTRNQGQRVLVLNGQQAGVQFKDTAALQWLDYGVPTLPGASGAARTPANAATQARASARVGLNQAYVEQSRGFNVGVQWPGGKQPARVEFKVQSFKPDPQRRPDMPLPEQSQVVGTVLVPLGQWVTVARQGGTAQAAEAGTYSTRNAEPVESRELQIRVDLAP